MHALAPDDLVFTHEDAADNEREPLLVLEPLLAFLDEHGLGSYAGIEVEPVGEGHSNVTFVVRRGADWEAVIRRPPRGPLPPSAHDVLREARVLSAIHGQARVPKVLAVGDDESVIGAPFYVMEKVEGEVVTSEAPPRLDTPEEKRRMGEELVDALVEVHAVEWQACGLEGFGKPTGYLERQLRRFGGLWDHNKTRELPRVGQLADWLAENMPESPPATIVHGDYRLGNVMFAHGAPARLVAIFDWELATIGDPLADLGYLTVTWTQPGDPEDTMWRSPDAVTRREGFQTRDELVALYEERSGRSMADLRWYQTLALWKAAVFMEGNYKRWLAGTTDDEHLALFDEGVPALAEAAWAAARS
jgi:aminoglycoside phosphotransferase (APT) family kinase protein